MESRTKLLIAVALAGLAVIILVLVARAEFSDPLDDERRVLPPFVTPAAEQWRMPVP